MFFFLFLAMSRKKQGKADQGNSENSRNATNIQQEIGLSYCWPVFLGYSGFLGCSVLIDLLMGLLGGRFPRWRCEITWKTAHQEKAQEEALGVL